MTVYIDKAFRCHAEPAEGRTAIDSTFFYGKCRALIECYRYVPDGHEWVRDDGKVFCGEMVSPHMDTTAAMQIQKEYEAMENDAAAYVEAYEAGVASVWA